MQKFRFADELFTSIEFECELTPWDFADRALDAIVAYRNKFHHVFHEADSLMWVRKFPPAYIQVCHEGDWYGTHALASRTLSIPARRLQSNDWDAIAEVFVDHFANQDFKDLKSIAEPLVQSVFMSIKLLQEHQLDRTTEQTPSRHHLKAQ